MLDLFNHYYNDPNSSLVGAAHVFSALLALVAGVILFMSYKGTIKHKWLGYFYLFAMLFLNIMALFRYQLTGGFNLFHFFAVFSLATIILATLFIRRAKKTGAHGDYMAHGIMMSWSYFGLFTALVSEAATRKFSYIFDGPDYWMSFGTFLTLFFVIVGGWTAWMIKRHVARILER